MPNETQAPMISGRDDVTSPRATRLRIRELLDEPVAAYRLKQAILTTLADIR
ncbi:MAG: hypothetical protein JO095_18720 [Alphaproteobacteria bacterium]|nr:hypothetical protein [Alphaproteobacteria bacterium]